MICTTFQAHTHVRSPVCWVIEAFDAGKASELPGHVWSFQDCGLPDPAFRPGAKKAATGESCIMTSLS